MIKRLNEQENRQPPPYSIAFGSRVAVLDIELRDARRIALPYNHLIAVAIQNGTQVEVLFTTRRITVIGRNLTPIYEAAASGSLKSVRELPPGDQNEQATTISEIEVSSIE